MSRLLMFAIAGLVLLGCVASGANDETVSASAAANASSPNSSLQTPGPSAAGENASGDAKLAQAAQEQAAPEILDIASVASQGGVLIGTVSPNAQSVTLDGEPLDIAADGRFLLGFNRDAGNQALLRVQYASGRSASRTITVNPRAWDIERVNLARRKRTASEAFKKRRAPELAQIVAARAARSDSSGWSQQFIWPATGRISGRFGNQRIYRGVPGGYHTGVDIARANGTPIVAPADGVVTLAATKPFSLEGNLLMLDHGMGLNSAFLHLSKIAVSKGDVVKKGQYIGNIGSTGSATGPHLHWSMKWNAARLDPMLLTGPME